MVAGRGPFHSKNPTPNSKDLRCSIEIHFRLAREVNGKQLCESGQDRTQTFTLTF